MWDATHGTYIASTPLAFHEDAEEPQLLPACSSGLVYKNSFTAVLYGEEPASVAPITARVTAEAYAKATEVLKDGDKTFGGLIRE